jgi:hyperosmotically inducible protein
MNRKIFAAMLIVAAGLVFSGCGEQGSAERAGEKIDKAAEQAGEQTEQAQEKMGEAVDQAGDKLENLGDKIEKKTDH